MNEFENLNPIVFTIDEKPVAQNCSNQTEKAQYNEFGYICPDENIYSPWENNAMFPGAAKVHHKNRLQH